MKKCALCRCPRELIKDKVNIKEIYNESTYFNLTNYIHILFIQSTDRTYFHQFACACEYTSQP